MRPSACERDEPSRLARMAARAFRTVSLLGLEGDGGQMKHRRIHFQIP